jgi:Dolichyl-phosphate-mannose-protein mannosyltransferase
MGWRVWDAWGMIELASRSGKLCRDRNADVLAGSITLLGFLARLWTASGTFLNPDEALHFRLANQTSLALAYKESLTAAHPPLLILLLYFWRALGTSELWLRFPSVLAGTVFCWMFYKWLSRANGVSTGLIGLLFVAFLPPIIVLTSEVRQYSLLLAFLACSLYFLDEAFATKSLSRMAASAFCLYLAMSVHYSAFWFAAALGIYALCRIFTEQQPFRLMATWGLAQLGGLALGVFFYRTHLSRMNAEDSRTVSQSLVSEYYLRRSFFERGHDNPLFFLIGHSFGVFQYFFGQLAVGIVMGLVFLAGIAILLRGRALWMDCLSARRLALFLLVPFAIIGSASLAHIYPYGGTRHIAILIIPSMVGISVALASLSGGRTTRDLAIAGGIILACIVFGKARQPRMQRADQSRRNMTVAMSFVKEKMNPSDIIFVDYQTDLILGHYLCQQRPIELETAATGFEQFSCDGHRIVSTNYKTEWMFWMNNFPKDWQLFVQAYGLKPGQTVWVFQSGWGVYLPEDLQKNFAEFRDLKFQTFGNNIKTFQMTVGQPMPPATE